MKKFIDEKGTFEIKVPSTWKYSLKDGKVHTFQEYEIWKSDAFQLSIREPKDETETLRFQEIIKSLKETKISGKSYYSYPDFKGNGFTTKTWTAQIECKIVLFTLTHSVSQDFKLDPKTIDEKIEIVHQIISEFKLIEPDKSEQEIKIGRAHV